MDLQNSGGKQSLLWKMCKWQIGQFFCLSLVPVPEDNRPPPPALSSFFLSRFLSDQLVDIFVRNERLLGCDKALHESTKEVLC